MEALCRRYGRGLGAEVCSPEFGGPKPESFGVGWAFGGGRTTSVTVFGPPTLINGLTARFAGRPGISIDAAPAHCFFSLHPGERSSNKGETLAALQRLGCGVVMIGNSMSDHTPSESGVQEMFVAGAELEPELRKVAIISEKEDVDGVIDCLSRICRKR